MPTFESLEEQMPDSWLDNQFILATSTAVVIVVCFTIWNFLELL
jgi:hypothetical protein